MTPNKVELHIDELILHGFALGDRYRIGQSLEAELTRLLNARGVPAVLTSNNRVARLDGGFFEISPGARPEAVGIQVAQAIYTRLQQG